ncbi:hypothetical protein L1987_89118 [Smallanthus sonchifolius]|nr:hypothetical protein L1987_89118 [Smallanthus sonchifolius]
MLFQIDHRSSRLAALLSELFCPLSLPLVLALISLQQLQYDSFIHLLPFIVVIARNSISLAIGIDVIFFLLSEGGPVESKKRHCKWRALTLIINKALLRSWGLGHIIKERIPRKGVKLRAFSILSEPFVCAYWKIWATSSLSDLIQIISQSGLLDSEWVREVLGLSPNVGLEALAESLNIPEGSQDKDSLKVLTELPRSQSMKVLALLVGSLVIVVMKNEGALLHFHDMGKDHGMRKRKKGASGVGKAVATRGVDSELRLNRKQQAASTTLKADCRHEMPIKSVKGSLIKAGKQEDLTELMMDRISKGERLS